IVTTAAPNGSNKLFRFTPSLSCYPPTALAITGGSITSSGVTFTTICNAANIPYTGMYFDPPGPDGFTIPNLPACTSQQNVGTGNLWVTDATNEEGWFDEHLMYNADGSNAANVWFFTKGINLVAGNTYRLSYDYGGSTNISTLTNKMLVAYGTSPAAASMTTQLADHPNIKVSPANNVVNFTATATGTFYFGFKAYSAANQGRLFLDNIEVVNSICKRPTALTVSSVSYNSASANWTSASPAPGSGYAYYVVPVSTLSPIAATAMVAGTSYVITSVGTTDFTTAGASSNAVGTVFTATGAGTGTGTIIPASTVPSSGVTPTGYTSAGTTLVTLTGLSANTTYAVWVRGNCGSPDDSEWSVIQVFTTLNTPPYCIPPASGSASTYVSNFTTTNAITNVNNSSVYTSPGYADYTNLIVTESQSGSFNFSVAFTDSGLGVRVGIYIDWNGDGDFFDAGETAYDSGGFLYVTPATGTINVPAGATLGITRMRVVADYWSTGFGPCAFATAGPRGEMEDYSFKIVTPPPPLTLNIASSTQCAGTNSPLVTITSLPLSNFDTYSWSPAAGVSGTAAGGYTFNSATTITYTLTGTQTSGTFSTNTATFTYIANPLPTPITLTPTPASAATCQSGPAVQINASGGVVSGVPVISENFNSGVATGWTFSNTSFNSGSPASSSWTIHPDGYDPTGPSWGVTIMHSNDASNFIFSDSDSNGIGSTTQVSMISPVFSLAGYTAASLKFWHFYRSWTPSTANVQISTNGTAGPWVTLQSFTSTTQGTPTSWVQVVQDLGAYLGQSNLAIKFDYNAGWGWGWGMDNFVVSGSATSSITWTPATGLYTDAAATTPYVAGTGAQVVYALPSTTTTYTASASTPMPTVCSTSTNQTITITPIVAGTLSSASQSTCDGTISNITLTGSSGTIVWQSATNATFTAGLTDIPGSNGVTTLTSAILGPVNTDLYIRVKVTNGTCTTYTTTHTITVPVSTWNGSWTPVPPTATRKAVFTANYSSTGNLTACSVLVTSGNVVFNAGHTLTAQNGVTVSGGTLTFNNNASLVQVNDAATNSGYVTYKRDAQPMIQYDYTYWSSPLNPQTLVGLSPLTLSDKYFQFNAAAGTYQNVPSNSLMDPGRGYIIRAPQSYTSTPTVFNGVFNGGSNDGVPNNGIISEPIVGGTKYNLLGNPYPSAIDADLFYAANSSLIQGNFYFWTHNTAIDPLNYTQSDYAVWNSTGGVGTAGGGTGNSTIPDGNIASGQGFFVVGTTSGTSTFNNSMRLTGLNGSFYRMSGVQSPPTIEKNRVWLEMTNASGAYKQTLVGYVEGATDGKDDAFDAAIADGGNIIGLYSILSENNLGIQGKALPFNVNDQIPLGYKTTVPGTFQIALSNADGLFADASQGIYLEDKVLNVIHDLRTGSYTFSTATGTFDDRFVLRYTDGTALGVNDATFTEQSVVVFKNETGLHINTSGITMDNIKIFDIRGRLILVKDHINSNETVITNVNVANQVLVVKIQSDDNRTVSKKVVY
ncbi:MAG: T9SS sorting signal type C domain-containing protein, partial [Sphingobacteriales bacterium]